MGTRAELAARLRGACAEHFLLENRGGGWAVVVPRLGARVLGAGADERNAFWVSPELERCLEGRDWNAGGQRTWLAPELGPSGFFGAAERDWAVPPPLDPGEYRVEEAGPRVVRCRSACRLRSQDGSEYSLEIERRTEVLDAPAMGPAAGLRLRLRHTLRNAGDRPIPARVGLWGILQLPALPEGRLLLPDLPYRVHFGELPGSWARREDGRLVLKIAPGRRWKVGQRPGPAAGEAEIAHRRPDEGGELEVTMRCPVRPDGLYLDHGDALQAYNSPLAGGGAFCELECHAPAEPLAPNGQSAVELEVEIRNAG